MARSFKVSGAHGSQVFIAKNESDARRQYKEATGCYSQTKVEKS